MFEGYVGGFVGGGGEVDVDQVCFYVIEVGGFGVESEQFGFFKFVELGVQIVFGEQGLVVVLVDVLFVFDVWSVVYGWVVVFQ